MRQGNLARPGNGAPAEQGHIRHRVVRRAERPHPAQDQVVREGPRRDGMDAEDFQMLVGRRRRHEGGDAFGDHRFSRSGRPDHQQVVHARHGDLDGPAQARLAFHLGEVRGVRRGQGARWRKDRFAIEGIQPPFACKEAAGLIEGVHPEDHDAVHQGRFLR